VEKLGLYFIDFVYHMHSISLVFKVVCKWDSLLFWYW